MNNTGSTACQSGRECICENGYGTHGVQCPKEGQNLCKNCKHGFYLSQDLKSCVSDICECSHGEAVVGELCNEHGREECKICDDLYHLEKNVTGSYCVPNECFCEYGDSLNMENVVPDNNCPSHGLHLCKPESCQIGYMFNETRGHCVSNGFECGCLRVLFKPELCRKSFCKS